MKLENLSVKKFLRLITVGLLTTSFLVLLGLFLVTKNLRLVLYGGLLTAVFLVWDGIFLHYFQKKLTLFTDSLCRTLDDMMDSAARPEMDYEAETLLARISHRLERLYNIMQKDRNTVAKRKLESEIRGQYQAVVMDTTQAEITHLSTQPEIEQWGLSQDFGTARYQDSNLIVEYADESWMVLGKKPSYVGTFPQAENEILVERAFLDYFGLPQKPGQIIRMNLGNGEQEYTISGILQAENTSRMFSVIVSRAFLEAQADGEPLFEFRFRFEGANRADLDALKADIAAFLTENDIPEAHFSRVAGNDEFSTQSEKDCVDSNLFEYDWRVFVWCGYFAPFYQCEQYGG